jgi:DNA-binding ferritin-like protein
VKWLGIVVKMIVSNHCIFLDNNMKNRLAQLLKFAEDSKIHDMMSTYVAYTRALYLLHQQNHWNAESYEDHLLFERIYNESLSRADEAAERVIGLFGSVNFSGHEMKLVLEWVPSSNDRSFLLKSSIVAERAFSEFANKLIDELKEADKMTPGLEDLIPAHVSMSETHLYLLQQTLKHVEKEYLRFDVKYAEEPGDYNKR